MEIEVQEFYPLKEGKEQKNGKIGTLHVYLPSLDLDIRGIAVFKKKRHYFIQPPSYYGPDKVRYPAVSFVNLETQVDFIKSLVRAGSKFMKGWKPE